MPSSAATASVVALHAAMSTASGAATAGRVTSPSAARYWCRARGRRRWRSARRRSGWRRASARSRGRRWAGPGAGRAGAGACSRSAWRARCSAGRSRRRRRAGPRGRACAPCRGQLGCRRRGRARRNDRLRVFRQGKTECGGSPCGWCMSTGGGSGRRRRPPSRPRQCVELRSVSPRAALQGSHSPRSTLACASR